MHFNNSIAHHKSAGINTKNYFKRLLQRGLYFYRLNEAKQKYQNLSQLFSWAHYCLFGYLFRFINR